ncbi:hypothetical protein HMPREF3293_02137 [Christensenella minuta]|uniref:Uncharacterized protein n=1 Tax=Christensenella minuta TaxID=626937 RepID=A0A136Q2I5_9FIRM|nr:hypothetical protein HMPREF3293_02137 [Christensenella minuta]
MNRQRRVTASVPQNDKLSAERLYFAGKGLTPKTLCGPGIAIWGYG